MAAIRLTNFKGIAPRVASRLLTDQNGVIAANCSLTSGELRPLNKPAIKFTPDSNEVIEALYYADGIWLSWGTDVDVARSPLPGEARFIYTGDGEPRITNATLAYGSGGGTYPEGARPLGLVGPKTAPTVTPAGSGSNGETVTRYYVYTFYDDWNQESAASPVSTAATSQTDDDWEITGMDTSPANSGSVTGVYSSPNTTFTMAASALHWLRTGDQIILGGGDTVTVASTPTTTTFTVAGDYSSETSWIRKSQWGTVTKRLYRTSGTTAEFRLVAIDIAAATTAFTDDIAEVDLLGDDLVSSEWALPPSDLTGIVTLPSGALAGFSGNEICFSEPFQPHAWPTAYRLRSPWTIVSLQYYSSGLVAGTEGNPFQVIGLDPGQMAAQPVNGVYPCVSKRSTVSLVSEVGFATKEGFVAIGDGGVSLISKDWFTRNEWNAYNPDTMEAAYVRGKLYIQSRGDTNQLLIFDFQDGTGLTTSYIDSTAMFADPTDGLLYFGHGTELNIKEFDPVSGTYQSQDWQSKQFTFPKPVNIGAAKLNFVARYTQEQYDALQAEYDAAVLANQTKVASGNIQGAVNTQYINQGYLGSSTLSVVNPPEIEAPGVTFILYANGEVKYSRYINDEKVFRLPSGFKSDTYSVGVQGQVLIKSVEVAEVPHEIGTV